jgi:long-chain acyl-CoA synthetase
VLGDYKFSTYRQTFEHIEAIERGILSLGIRKGDRILIFSETRSEWLLTALAAFRHAFTVVTLYATLGEEAVRHGINESERVSDHHIARSRVQTRSTNFSSPLSLN